VKENIKHIKNYGLAGTAAVPALTVEQLQCETEKLKQKLGCMIDENVGLKCRLSEALQQKFDKNMLPEAEGYQNYFIREDELIGLLRNDVAILDKLMKTPMAGKGTGAMGSRLQQLRRNILFVDDQFKQLKAAFVNYLVKNNLA
jgi:hypothetical protein